MNKGKRNKKRILSLLLALTMVLSSFAGSAKEAKAATTTLTYEVVGGTGDMAPVDLNVGETFTLPAPGFTASEGREFVGWVVLDEDIVTCGYGNPAFVVKEGKEYKAVAYYGYEITVEGLPSNAEIMYFGQMSFGNPKSMVVPGLTGTMSEANAFLITGMTSAPGFTAKNATVELAKTDEESGSYIYLVTDITGPVTVTMVADETGGEPTAPITITTQPQSVTAKQGEKATFTVEAKAAAGITLKYQWQVDCGGGEGFRNADGNGTTSATYTTYSLDGPENGYKYRCVITDANDSSVSVTSEEVTLKVITLPKPTKIEGVSITKTDDGYKVTGLADAGEGYRWGYNAYKFDGDNLDEFIAYKLNEHLNYGPWEDEIANSFNESYVITTYTNPNIGVSESLDDYDCIEIVKLNESSLICAVAVLALPKAASEPTVTPNPSEHDGHTGWTEFSGTSITRSGKYYLTGNLSTSLNINATDVTLCLNGYTISNSSCSNTNPGTVIIGEDCNVTICDCQKTGCIKSTHQEIGLYAAIYNYGTVNLYDITVDAENSKGRGISCDNRNAYTTVKMKNCTVKSFNEAVCMISDTTDSGLLIADQCTMSSVNTNKSMNSYLIKSVDTVLTNCTLTSKSAVFSSRGNTVSFSNCNMTGDFTAGEGSAYCLMYILSSTADVEFKDCTITNLGTGTVVDLCNRQGTLKLAGKITILAGGSPAPINVRYDDENDEYVLLNADNLDEKNEPIQIFSYAEPTKDAPAMVLRVEEGKDYTGKFTWAGSVPEGMYGALKTEGTGLYAVVTDEPPVVEPEEPTGPQTYKISELELGDIVKCYDTLENDVDAIYLFIGGENVLHSSRKIYTMLEGQTIVEPGYSDQYGDTRVIPDSYTWEVWDLPGSGSYDNTYVFNSISQYGQIQSYTDKYVVLIPAGLAKQEKADLTVTADDDTLATYTVTGMKEGYTYYYYYEASSAGVGASEAKVTLFNSEEESTHRYAYLKSALTGSSESSYYPSSGVRLNALPEDGKISVPYLLEIRIIAVDVAGYVCAEQMVSIGKELPTYTLTMTNKADYPEGSVYISQETGIMEKNGMVTIQIMPPAGYEYTYRTMKNAEITVDGATVRGTYENGGIMRIELYNFTKDATIEIKSKPREITEIYIDTDRYWFDDDLQGPNWTWDGETHTLTLNGVTIESEDGDGESAIIIPCGSTIVLAEGTRNVISGYRNGIYIKESFVDLLDLKITGTGTLEIENCKTGIYVTADNLVFDQGTVIIKDSGISAMEVVGSSKQQHSMTFTPNAKVKVMGTIYDCPIDATGCTITGAVFKDADGNEYTEYVDGIWQMVQAVDGKPILINFPEEEDPAPEEPTTTPEPEEPTTTPKPEEPTTTPKPEDPTTTPKPEDPTTTPAPEEPTTTPEPEEPTTTPEPEDPTTTPEPEDPTTTPEPEDPTTTPTPEAPTPTPEAPTPTPEAPAPTPEAPAPTPEAPAPSCSHNWTTATCESYSYCRYCGAWGGSALGHDWNEATCTEAKTCDRCGETVGEALGHDWSGKWTIIKEATATEEGKQELLCARDCGQKKVVTIPATGVEAEPDDNGNLEKDAEVAPEAPIKEATLDNQKSELVEASGIFTEKEKKEVENGSDARVWIEISKTMEDSIAKKDKEEIKNAAEKIMGEQTNITYFDADLFKQVGAGKKTQISEPGIAMQITIKIPEKLQNHDKKVVREYKVLRLHDGVVDVLEGIFDALTGEFSFESDKFSIYAIAYIDTPVADVTEPEDGGEDVTTPEDGGDDVTKPEESDKDEKDDVPKTGEGANAPLMWTLLLLLAAAIAVYGKKWQERQE